MNPSMSTKATHQAIKPLELLFLFNLNLLSLELSWKGTKVGDILTFGIYKTIQMRGSNYLRLGI
jgi:hypothetical protein